jgi:ribosomal protein RSM22 (predicted rRNA methylase)
LSPPPIHADAAGARRACIAAVEEALRATPDRDLARAVERLSDLYTTGRGALAAEQADAAHLAAKCEYFLASDAPKVGLALDECAARHPAFRRLGAARALRVVDLGAGVGATSVGFLAWLHGACAAANTAPPAVELVAIELGAPAARAYERAVRAAAAHAGVELSLRVECRDFRSAAVPDCDLALCQTAINELLVGERHSSATIDLVAGWAARAPLVVIEPALRVTTRALMALRDAVIARGAAHPVAPCLHAAPCPMLAREGDWCHEARRIEPTPRVAAIDAIVGRRDERALFAFLATAPGAAAPRSEAAARFVRLVTDPLGSRGKTERLVCRDDGALRLMRLLDREVRPENRGFLDLERGGIVSIVPIPDNDRIGPEVRVRETADASEPTP